MKKIKYVLVTIIIGILVFIAIEMYRDNSNDNINKNSVNESTNTLQNENSYDIENEKNEEEEISEEITDGEELLQKAEKTLNARGWAGASNNLIGLKDGILYYYNTETKEFEKLATGIADIYYETEDSETIVAEKTDNSEILEETPEYIQYK